MRYSGLPGRISVLLAVCCRELQACGYVRLTQSEPLFLTKLHE